MADTRQTIRDELVQTLLHRLEKDYSDLRNLSDIRLRFIPRQALLDTISLGKVVRLLGTLPTPANEDSTPLQDIARYISPQPGGCRCQKEGCTGKRMILATLLFIGREDLITTFTPSKALCDQDLPLDSSRSDTRILATQGHQNEGIKQANRPDTIRFDRLSSSEVDLFSYWQWQVMSPYLTALDSDTAGAKEQDEVCLPWKELVNIKARLQGEFSYVQKVQIFPGNHNLGQHPNDVYALKTFEEAIMSGLTVERFRRELDANRYAPKHSRIVPVLAAFEHRRKCHLVFPWADGGSLEDIWRNYTPMHLEPQNDTQSAPWCSETWLLRECRGIAEALVATHGLANDGQSRSRAQIHADIKPENILCFFHSENGVPSITMKLADFGEAIQVPKNSEFKANRVPHTKTYRPPEYKPLSVPRFNYDIWCLGCMYLEFITWFLDGWQGVETFKTARENEPDAKAVTKGLGEMIEDVFFKRVRQSRIPRIRTESRSKSQIESNQHITKRSFSVVTSFGVEFKLKTSVLSHMESLKEHRDCNSSSRLKRFLDFIGNSMLLVDTKERVESIHVLEKLDALLKE